MSVSGSALLALTTGRAIMAGLTTATPVTTPMASPIIAATRPTTADITADRLSASVGGAVDGTVATAASTVAAASTAAVAFTVADTAVVGTVVVGTIIGSGIFLVPAEMMQAVGSAKLVYLAWLVGGFLSFFGALTYIGNGPNFMVKAVAEQQRVATPTFFGFIFKFAVPFLLPVLIVVWVLFFRC